MQRLPGPPLQGTPTTVQVLHKLYHDAEDEWRMCTGQRCGGFNHFPDWEDRALFAESHRLLSIALLGRELHSQMFWSADERYGGYVDPGHNMCILQLGQTRFWYEEEAGANGMACIRTTSDRDVKKLLYKALETQITADTDQDGLFDYVLRVLAFETYKEVSPGTEGFVYRPRRFPSPPLPVKHRNWDEYVFIQESLPPDGIEW